MSSADKESLAVFLDNWLPAHLAMHGVPGVMVGIADNLNATPLVSAAYGTHTPSISSVIPTASLSKLVTAIAILQLHEQQVLDLDAPVVKYIPELVIANDTVSVTVRMLLSHRSGLTREGVDHQWPMCMTSYESADLLAALGTQAFSAGKTFKYSNQGYVLLGMVIERITGCNYSDYVQEHVYARAGLTQTCATIAGVARSDIVPGYAIHNRTDELSPVTTPVDAQEFSPAFGMVSSISDCLRLLQVLQEDGTLLTANSLRLLRTAETQFGAGQEGYGLGCELDHNGSVYGHSGQFLGGSVDAVIIDDTWSVAVWANCYSDVVWSIRDTIRQLLRTPLALAPADQASCLGWFRSTTSDIVVCTATNGDIFVYDPAKSSPLDAYTILTPVNDTTYRNTETNGYGYAGEIVTMHSHDGRVEMISVEGQQWQRVT